MRGKSQNNDERSLEFWGTPQSARAKGDSLLAKKRATVRIKKKQDSMAPHFHSHAGLPTE